MAGTSILASICAGRLTKFLVQQSKAQSHQIQTKARLTAQALSPKAAEGCGYMQHYAPSSQMASRQMPKVLKYDFTTQWTSSVSGCQQSGNIYNLVQPKGTTGDKKPVQMSQPLEASRKLMPILYPGKMSREGRAQMSPTLLMGRRYTMGPLQADNRQQRLPPPMLFDRIKLYRNFF